MKKIFTSFIVLATLSLSANAQWYLGGGTGFDFISIDGATHATFSIAPEGGYNFNDKMSAGLAIPIIFSTSTSVSIDPYFRYKFVKFGPVTLFADAYAEFGSIASEFSWGIGAAPGLMCDIKNNWSIAGCIGNIGYNNINGFNLHLINSISVGVYKTF